MDFTYEMSKMFGVLPFEILKQDKDEVIMLINYMSEKGGSETIATTEKEKDRGFWSSV